MVFHEKTLVNKQRYKSDGLKTVEQFLTLHLNSFFVEEDTSSFTFEGTISFIVFTIHYLLSIKFLSQTGYQNVFIPS